MLNSQSGKKTAVEYRKGYFLSLTKAPLERRRKKIGGGFKK
jgi:hypothetical protein